MDTPKHSVWYVTWRRRWPDGPGFKRQERYTLDWYADHRVAMLVEYVYSGLVWPESVEVEERLEPLRMEPNAVPLSSADPPQSGLSILTLAGVSKTVEEWADVLGVKPNTLWSRKNVLQWDDERILTTPVRIYKLQDDRTLEKPNATGCTSQDGLLPSPCEGDRVAE